MSSYYTIDFEMDLRRDLSEVEDSALQYLIHGNAGTPTELPTHRFFKDGLPKFPYWYSYRDFPSGPFVSSIWEHGRDTKGAFKKLCLRLPSQKQEGFYEQFLEFGTWLATLSTSNGFVGSVREEGIEKLSALIFIYNCELYIDFEPKYDPKSMVSGKPRKHTERQG